MCFDDEMAIKYGVNEAIMMWLLEMILAQRHEEYFSDGRYWLPNCIGVFENMCPFWTNKQIRKIVQSLINQKVLIARNYDIIAFRNER